MISPLRATFFILAAFSFLHATSRAADKAAPVASPAFVDVVSFEFKNEGEHHKTIVVSGPTLLRVDEPEDNFSFIFDPATEHYTGLEHRNYTWWEFSWPEVRDAVEGSKRNATRLEDLNNENAQSMSLSPTTNAAPSSTSLDVDDSGYVWQPTTQHKQVNDRDCVLWTGNTQSGENVAAWCVADPMPKVQAAIEHLRLVNEPMALVPIRTIAPDFIFPVYHALAKGGVTPLLISWGDDQNRNTFHFLEAKTVSAKPGLFSVPKLYNKTTLISMDGLTPQHPAIEPRTGPKQKTWQNP